MQEPDRYGFINGEAINRRFDKGKGWKGSAASGDSRGGDSRLWRQYE